ncbi:hypothetical protein GCM10007989_06650 [Devosia pacifica]|uniref:DUF6468 domain-containing protein n=1 Tax=Devosia pacifica TaxID=1335967 RepID=A0A918RXJ1_9HYPH|nr:DUF6468 domain-containing protein [Devosia pacifica]GHA14621.1 hypothetical protein GCM10007989_06650 [Devosia pacifica]
MSAFPLGLVIEGSVAILLALTIGYCVVLNARLKRLHQDRDQLRDIVNDLVNATNLANRAIQELKVTAQEADSTLSVRLEEADRFGVELANHVSAGTALMERIVQITSAARQRQPLAPPEPQATKVQAALQQLSDYGRNRGEAA